MKQLEALYQGGQCYHGELHDHSNSGGTSDGKRTLAEWRERMKLLKMDFVAILDHRQIRHMYLPEWEDGLFISGTEPGTTIVDSAATVKGMHYNILLPERDELPKLLEAFPEYEFSGGVEGHFVYPTFTRERFGELIDAIKARGGLFVHPHPTLVMQSDDPCDYWFRDETGIEVFYGDMASEHTSKNYKLWTELLAAGKRVWACAGCDAHCDASTGALTTIYAEEKTNASFLSHLSRGDFTCGPVGIRMCIGNTTSGGHCHFYGQKLKVAVGDFHESVMFPEHEYRLDVLNEQGAVFSSRIDCTSTSFFELPTENCRYYRAEVFDETRNLRIAIGNPIWNDEEKNVR